MGVDRDRVAYNGLVQRWPEISRLAQRDPATQADLLAGDPRRGDGS